MERAGAETTFVLTLSTIIFEDDEPEEGIEDEEQDEEL